MDTAYVYFWAKITSMTKKKSIDFPVIMAATAKDELRNVLGSSSQTGMSIAP